MPNGHLHRTALENAKVEGLISEPPAPKHDEQVEERLLFAWVADTKRDHWHFPIRGGPVDAIGGIIASSTTVSLYEVVAHRHRIVRPECNDDFVAYIGDALFRFEKLILHTIVIALPKALQEKPPCPTAPSKSDAPPARPS